MRPNAELYRTALLVVCLAPPPVCDHAMGTTNPTAVQTTKVAISLAHAVRTGSFDGRGIGFSGYE